MAYIPDHEQKCTMLWPVCTGQNASQTELPPKTAPPRFRTLVLWVLVLTVGFVGLLNYEFAGAAPSGIPTLLPLELRNATLPPRPTLLFFVHPRCPCTAAGIAELDRVLSDFPDAFETTILFPTPAGAPEGWVNGPNREAVGRLPGVSVRTDTDARLSAIFQVTTSGTALVYDRDGQLVFHGGLTASRGHEGSNFGELALRAVAQGKVPVHVTTPVFGCQLRQLASGENWKAPP